MSDNAFLDSKLLQLLAKLEVLIDLMIKEKKAEQGES